MARVWAREGAGRCLLAVPWPEELSFAPEFGSFRSWWVVPTAFILQREGGRFETCHRAWVSLNQRKSLVWTKHRGAVSHRLTFGSGGLAQVGTERRAVLRVEMTCFRCAQRKAVISLLDVALFSTRPYAEGWCFCVSGVRFRRGISVISGDR